MELGYLWLARAVIQDPKMILKTLAFIPRLATSPLRVLPDFIVLGFPKCGTTSLYEYLVMHPSVGAAFQKEIFFFLRHYRKGTLWYRAYFPTVLSRMARKGFITGEATPSYALYPDTYGKIRKLNPSIKLIVMLRDPADKAYSNFNHLLREGLVKEGELEKMVELDMQGRISNKMKFHNIVSSGLYADYMEKLYSVFPREQVLVIRSEDFFDNPEAAVNECFMFLGLPRHRLNEYKNANPGNYRPMPAGLRKRLKEYYRPHNKRLAGILGRDMKWD